MDEAEWGPETYPHYYLTTGDTWANWEATRRGIEHDLDRGHTPTVHHHRSGEKCNDKCARVRRLDDGKIE